jgi:4-hydroxy-3-polyprenylbenzoate decarboxylase
MKNYDSLSDFVSQLEDDGELGACVAGLILNSKYRRRRRLCDASHHIRLSSSACQRHSTRLSNLLGSESRILKALRTESFEEAGRRIAALLQPDLPEGWLEAVRLVPQISQLTRLPPKIVRTALCQQVVRLGRDVDLSHLPVPRFWPEDAAPVIDGTALHQSPHRCEHRHGSARGRDHNTLVVWTHHDSWQIFQSTKSGCRCRSRWCSAATRCCVRRQRTAPLIPTNACWRIPARANIELVKCRTVDLEVPSTAEIVLEGMIDPQGRLESAGPVACPTGFYDEPQDVPLLGETALTHRSNPIFPARIFSRPPAEDFWIGQATERIFCRLCGCLCRDCRLSPAARGGRAEHCVCQHSQRIPAAARKVMQAAVESAGVHGVEDDRRGRCRRRCVRRRTGLVSRGRERPPGA